MKRKICALAAALLVFFAGAAAAEEETVPPSEPVPGLATPTDLCAHENTKTVYYFDAPYYYPLNAESHSVIGRALQEEICLDCGSVLFSEMVDNAYEVHPHVFRNNQCVLCGQEFILQETGPAAEEAVLFMSAAEDSPDQFFYTVTAKDLEKAKSVLVLRPEGRDAALALQAVNLREAIGGSGGSVVAEMKFTGNRAVSVSVRLYGAAGAEAGFGWISLRVYGKKGGGTLSVTYKGPGGRTAGEEAGWADSGGGEGFWTVSWHGDGVYEFQ